MADRQPTILVVGDDWDERGAIAAVLREAGFAVAAERAPGNPGGTIGRRFAAAVIALPGKDGAKVRRRLRRRQPDHRRARVAEAAAVRTGDADDSIGPVNPG